MNIEHGNLNGADEDSRRFAIMEASRKADASLLPRLFALLEIDTYANRRHVVRALGNIGGEQSERRLLQLLESEDGLILGDIAVALGKLASREAVSRLQDLEKHPLNWVAQSARAALRMIGEITEPNAEPDCGGM